MSANQFRLARLSRSIRRGAASFWKWLSDPHRLTAISTLAIFLATAVAAGVGIAQWRALHSTDEKIGRQLAMMESDQRPWVDIRDIKLTEDIGFDQNGARITVGFDLINTGRGPARLTDFSFNAFLLKAGWTDKIRKFEVAAEHSVLTEDTIFPDNIGLPRGAVSYIPRSEIEAVKQTPGRILYIVAQVCAKYEFYFKSGEHRTCKTIRITQSIGYLLSVPDPETNVPQSNVGGQFMPGGSMAN
jgi:hypothetical protein